MSSSMTIDNVKHIGDVARWLEAAPSLKTEYGEFYVKAVTVCFDGETLGTFTVEDNTYTPTED